MIRKKNLGIILLILLNIFSSVFADEIITETEPTLCKSYEKNIFSCATGEKVISLCAVIKESKEKNILIYRFGKQNSTPELEYSSKEGEDINKYFQYAYRTYSKGSMFEVEFKKGKYTYTIAQESHAYIAPNVAGVLVEKDNKRIVELMCNQSNFRSNLYDLSLKENFEFTEHILRRIFQTAD